MVCPPTTTTTTTTTVHFYYYYYYYYTYYYYYYVKYNLKNNLITIPLHYDLMQVCCFVLLFFN